MLIHSFDKSVTDSVVCKRNKRTAGKDLSAGEVALELTKVIMNIVMFEAVLKRGGAKILLVLGWPGVKFN